MTLSQQSQFQEQGYLLLRGVLRARVRDVREHVLAELRRKRIWASGKLLSTALKNVPPFQQVGKLGQLIKCPDLGGTLLSDEVRTAVHSLSGTKLTAPGEAQLLVSLPNQGEWTLDGLNWHVDVSSPDRDRIPGIQVFALIDDVAPQGGATLAIAGSHRPDKQQAVRRLRATGRGNGRLTEELRDGLSLLEMCGSAGDVYLMDMRVLHSPAFNATRHIRMMATARYLTT
jgi:hypothetical protein